MTDLALQVAGSKLAISIVLGGTVWLSTRGDKRPRMCHALCLSLLAVLLVPPLVAVPVLQSDVPVAVSADGVLADGVLADATSLGAGGDVQLIARGKDVDGRWLGAYGGTGLVLLWLLGIAVVAGWTLVRTRLFRRFLRGASREAPAPLQSKAGQMAHTLGLSKVPPIYTTDALVSPMACWTGGAVRVYIPSALLRGMESTEVRWILAHELAHVRRRDHLVRWLEWLACTLFWWNPIAWWARRRLGAAGEVCCDTLVVRAFDCAPRAYASALMRAIDLVRAGRMPGLPPFSSAAGSGQRIRVLERRLQTILTNRPVSPPPPALRLAKRGAFAALLALGLVYCGEQPAVTAGELPGTDLLHAAVQNVDPGPVDATLAPGWTVPSDPEDVWLEAHDLRWTPDGKSIVPQLGLLVVDYDHRVPPLENEALWDSVGELPASDRDADFLVARQGVGGEWVFLDDIPQGSSSTVHLIASKRCLGAAARARCRAA